MRVSDNLTMAPVMLLEEASKSSSVGEYDLLRVLLSSGNSRESSVAISKVNTWSSDPETSIKI